MISGFTQTAAIIRLNFTRQIVKGKIKYALLFLLALSLLPFIVIKSLSISHQVSSTPSHKVFPMDISLDPTNLDSATISKLTANSQIQQTTRADFISKKEPTLLLTFNSFDAANQKYDYTLTTSQTSDSLSSLWLCITPNSCMFSPSMKEIAETKNIIDRLLRGDNSPELVMLEISFTGNQGLVGVDFFKDFFFFALSPMIIYALFEEKSKGLKFGLFMTGVKRSSYYIGLFFIPMLIATLFSALTLYMFVDIWDVPSATGPLAILVFCSSYGYVGFAWICAQLAPNVRAANLISTVYIGLGFVSFMESSKILQYIPSWATLLLCVIPRFGLSTYFAVSQITGNDKGFSSTSIPFMNSVITSTVCFTIGIFLFGAYLNWLEVSQDEIRPIHYPISRFFKKRVAVVEERTKVYAKIELGTSKGTNPLETVTISNLSKLYAGATTKALTDVSLEFAKGEIFGLLGYNGAGKSTFINILCGVLSTTEGSVNVFGLDAKQSRYEIAARTGVCSQIDILYDDLTTREHLFFFGLMRGVPSSEIKQKIDEIVRELHISEHMLNSQSKVLSAGQKRKLGVALAFINDPELVVLDEMSSGVDPENRRVIWDFLMKRKRNRAILLCTHFMDEADIVCDRKAMLTLGQLVCVGSSEYLKEIYNTGYTLSVEKKDPSFDPSIQSWFRNRNIKVTIGKTSKQIVEYQIGANYLSALVDFERDGEIQRAIRSYSIQENGLEQIFTNKELVDEKDITLTAHEQQTLLNHMSSFVEPSFAAKTGFYLNFEMKRLVSSFVENFFRMSISLILVILLWVFIKGFGASYTLTEKVSFDKDIYTRLLPNGFVLETNINGLISNNPSRFVPVNSTGSSVSMGTLLSNATGTFLTVFGDYDGAPFLAMSNLFQNSLITSSFEYYANVTGNTFSYESVVIIILQLLYADFLVNLTDDIAESKEKIKFLLLSAGVPLGSYWIVIFIRSLLIVAPFLILTVVVLPSSYHISGLAAFAYLLQPVFFAALIGSFFAKNSVSGITQSIRLFGLLVFLIFILVGSIENWGPNQYKYLHYLNVVLSPYLPLSVTSADMADIEVLSDTQMLANAVFWSILYFVVFLGVELRHLFIRNIAPFSKSFVSFNSITKKFGRKKIAVNDLNLQIEKNEMFAFLGPNGCGKTTSLSMLTAQALPTKGSIHMDNLHVASKKLDAIKKIGFCPQFDDLLIANMTVGQHLHLFCAMNGIPEARSEDYITNLLRAFGIERFKNVNCGSLSGGTKRKVSSAIAVMLPRSLVVLDEASTGLDPLARQKLWNTVRLLNVNRTTIMTTHYISETSYCDKIAIMTDGNLQACATEYELTRSSANGYKATLHLNSRPGNLLDFIYNSLFFDDQTAQVEIENVVGESVLANFKHFRLPLGVLVSRLSNLKRQGHLKNFTVGRMALEDVFLDIVKKSTTETV
ncbi:hypothetical protein HDV01_005165 [Terramyces sp. JEL0728]|nr:hypothetical protein HDV01_005165 [Terramyces sp. JEL0728]